MRLNWLVGVCVAFAAHAHALVIGVYELSPHIVADAQKDPTGAVVDFVQDVLVKSGEFPVVEWRVANFARTLRDLEVGKLDMVFWWPATRSAKPCFATAANPCLTRARRWWCPKPASWPV